MNRIQTTALISLITLLILLIFADTIIRSFFQNKSTSLDQKTKNVQVDKTPTYTPQELQARKRIVDTASKQKGLNESQMDRFEAFKLKLPLSTNFYDIDFGISFSDIYIYKKIDNADAQINQVFVANNIDDIRRDFPSLFTFVTKPIPELRESERKQLESQQNTEPNIQGVSTSTITALDAEAQNQLNSPCPDTYYDPDEPCLPDSSDLISIVDLFKDLVAFSTSEKTSTVTADLSPSSNQSQPGNTPPYDATGKNALLDETGSDLNKIMNEAATKVGVPARIVKGIISNECHAVISLPNEKIAEYSLPGKGIPDPFPNRTVNCYLNHAGAEGPAQFIDKKGKSGISTWVGYKNSVQKYGGATYEPYIENIRDSAYAAAAYVRMIYLKAGGKLSEEWSFENVRKVGIGYNAGPGRIDMSDEQLAQRVSSEPILYYKKLWESYVKNEF